jgi:hypothetical protein
MTLGDRRGTYSILINISFNEPKIQFQSSEHCSNDQVWYDHL